MSEFNWPGINSDIKRFCQPCDICQRTIPKGKIVKAPLGKMARINVPFRRVATDLIGLLKPVTYKKNRYILTLVDYATRYPEAEPLASIDTKTVAEALVSIFSRVRIPNEILTDMGTQYASAVMKEVSRLLSFKQLVTTPYHPICNGLVEWFNQTIKKMLMRMCAVSLVDLTAEETEDECSDGLIETPSVCESGEGTQVNINPALSQEEQYQVRGGIKKFVH